MSFRLSFPPAILIAFSASMLWASEPVAPSRGCNLSEKLSAILARTDYLQSPSNIEHLVLGARCQCSAWKTAGQSELVVVRNNSKRTVALPIELKAFEPMSMSPDGQLIWLGNRDKNKWRVLDAQSGTVIYSLDHESAGEIPALTLLEAQRFIVHDNSKQSLTLYKNTVSGAEKVGSLSLPPIHAKNAVADAYFGNLSTWIPSYSPHDGRLLLFPRGKVEDPKVLVYSHIGNRFKLRKEIPLPIEETLHVGLAAPTKAQIAKVKLEVGGKLDEAGATVIAKARQELNLPAVDKWSLEPEKRTVSFKAESGKLSGHTVGIYELSTDSGQALNHFSVKGLEVDAFAFDQTGDRIAVVVTDIKDKLSLHKNMRNKTLRVYKKTGASHWELESEALLRDLFPRAKEEISGAQRTVELHWVEGDRLRMSNSAGEQIDLKVESQDVKAHSVY